MLLFLLLTVVVVVVVLLLRLLLLLLPAPLASLLAIPAPLPLVLEAMLPPCASRDVEDLAATEFEAATPLAPAPYDLRVEERVRPRFS